MGTFSVPLSVSNGNGGEPLLVDVLVDTGATFTVLPESLLRERVGIQPKEEVEFTLADGSLKTLPVGEARLSVEGREGPNPVVFGAEDQYLLGATALQVLRLIPDTTNHKLIPAPRLPI